MCKSRRQAVLLATYLIGLGVAALSLKIAISIGIVLSILWLFNHDIVSFNQNNMKRGN
ncbi:hypothetical protein DOK76_03810 [Vagococcus sp. DIV0080]|uniref:Uncharacterized protein n=1 Tax=Candidatus Vagococcus giribetii TaxID=2230876 RepID=A0ABS3HTM8_9ENTE|nr:hypothetical protein [Vagococcus sp. DIV0080]MBO0476181.1 hypothetical protein [Vagococcus sp. DIV0080]